MKDENDTIGVGESHKVVVTLGGSGKNISYVIETEPPLHGDNVGRPPCTVTVILNYTRGCGRCRSAEGRSGSSQAVIVWAGNLL